MADSEFEKKEIKKAKLINYGIFSIFCVLFTVVCIWLCSYKYWHSFSSEKWVNYPEKRAGMTADLFKKYELVGMSEAEIITLLGQHNNNYGYFNREERFVYYLGSERSIIDSEWLLIDFKNGIAAEYSMTTD